MWGWLADAGYVLLVVSLELGELEARCWKARAPRRSITNASVFGVAAVRG